MNEEILKLFDDFKVVVYIPKSYGDKMIEQILERDINRIGEYLNCMSWGEVTSTWTPLERANPLIGKNGERSIEPEIRLEFKCKRENLKEIVGYVNAIHPYEKAEIDIIPFFTQDALLG